MSCRCEGKRGEAPKRTIKRKESVSLQPDTRVRAAHSRSNTNSNSTSPAFHKDISFPELLHIPNNQARENHERTTNPTHAKGRLGAMLLSRSWSPSRLSRFERAAHGRPVPKTRKMERRWRRLNHRTRWRRHWRHWRHWSPSRLWKQIGSKPPLTQPAVSSDLALANSLV